MRGQIPGKDGFDQGSFGGLDPDPCGVTRALEPQPIAVRRHAPGQQQPCLQLVQAAATHPFCDKHALVLSDRTANLQQELVVRILAHRAIEKLDVAARPFELLQQEHLVDIVACQTVGCGEDDLVTLRGRDRIAQGIQSRSAQRGAAHTVVAKDPLLVHISSVVGAPRPQARELLVTGLLLGLSLSRHPHIEGRAPRVHPVPPGRRDSAPRVERRPGSSVAQSTRAAVGTPDSTGAAHGEMEWPGDAGARGVS
jgi:hypothetical protein